MDLSSLARPGWVPMLCGMGAVTTYVILRQDERVSVRPGRLMGLSMAAAIIGAVWFWAVAAFTAGLWTVPDQSFGMMGGRGVMGSIVLAALAWAVVPWAFVTWRLSAGFDMLWNDASRSALRLCLYLGAVFVMVATVRVALG